MQQTPSQQPISCFYSPFSRHKSVFLSFFSLLRPVENLTDARQRHIHVGVRPFAPHVLPVGGGGGGLPAPGATVPLSPPPAAVLPQPAAAVDLGDGGRLVLDGLEAHLRQRQD